VSIKNKANIITDDFHLYAYKIIQFKSNFNALLTGELFAYNAIHNFSLLLLDNIKPSIKFPFIYSCNNSFEWNKTDSFRNISVLSDIFKYCHIYPNIATKREIIFMKNRILNIVQNIDQYDSQSLSFLGYFYKMYNINHNAYCKKLLSDLPFSEKEFERQEIIIGLNDANCNIQFTNLTYNLDDSIFKMNWVIQAIISYNKVPSSNLINILERKILNIIDNIKLVETNELAVSFEALSFVYSATQILSPLLFQLFFELEQRKNCVNALYSFLDNSARVDITCHILNGLIQLQ
jgi:hypothetical protein